jgi:hypothetical protein
MYAGSVQFAHDVLCVSKLSPTSTMRPHETQRGGVRTLTFDKTVAAKGMFRSSVGRH